MNLETPKRRMTDLPGEATLAFAPLHKRAFGMAVGLVFGGLIAAATIVAVLAPVGRAEPLGLLGAYFTGYSVSWRGAVLGFLWGGFSGFVGGWFLAFCRNLVLTVSLAYIRARHELQATRDLMDHI